jgi:NMD protein affecting ribosome stability and mRNA decay
MSADLRATVPRCDECQYCFAEEQWIEDENGRDYVWGYHCNLAVAGGKTIVKEDGEDRPAWCPLLPKEKR